MKFNNRILIVCCVVMMLSLSACTNTSPVRVDIDKKIPVTAKRLLSDINVWCMNGRSSAKFQKTGWQAGIKWCQTDSKTALELTGPINLGRVSIRYYLGELWISESRDQLSISHSAEKLLESRLGFKVPLSAFRFWLIGTARPGIKSSRELDHDGNLSLLKQHDWMIRYSNYRAVNGYLLPGKIKLTNTSVSLKIVADNWDLQE